MKEIIILYPESQYNKVTTPSGRTTTSQESIEAEVPEMCASTWMVCPSLKGKLLQPLRLSLEK